VQPLQVSVQFSHFIRSHCSHHPFQSSSLSSSSVMKGTSGKAHSLGLSSQTQQTSRDKMQTRSSQGRQSYATPHRRGLAEQWEKPINCLWLAVSLPLHACRYVRQALPAGWPDAEEHQAFMALSDGRLALRNPSTLLWTVSTPFPGHTLEWSHTQVTPCQVG